MSRGSARHIAVRAPPAVETEGTGPVRSVSIRPVPLGAGGFITGIDQSSDGQRFVCRADVCNAYIRDVGDAAWRPLFSTTTLDRANFDPLPQLGDKADGRGVAGVRIAPSDKHVIYASYSGYIWRSVDGGKTVQRTALQQKRMPANAGPQRCFNPTIDVHPYSSDQVVVATWDDGIWYSDDGGRDWSEIALPRSLPLDGQPGASLVLFGHDPSHIFVFIGGAGLFASYRGLSGRFSPVAGGPARCSSMVAGGDGTIHLCEYMPGEGGRLWHYRRDNGWRHYDNEREMVSVTVNPKDPRSLYVCGPYTYGAISTDGGISFTDYLPEAVEGEGEVRWITALKGIVMGHVIWDSTDTNRLWLANGVGVSMADLRAGVRTDWSAGIEELPGISGISAPGGGTVLTSFDKPLWLVTDEHAYTNHPTFPVVEKDAPLDIVTHGTYVDYAGNDPNFLVAMVSVGNTFETDYGPGFSSDGGRSWTRFVGQPPDGWALGGCIAASTSRNFVALPSDNGFGTYTLDGGNSWMPVRLDGVNATSHFANAYYVSRKNIAADKTRPGTFALVYTVQQEADPTDGNPLGGVWLTTDGGQSWRQTRKGVIRGGDGDPPPLADSAQDMRQFWQCQLDYVPGHRRELVYTPHADFSDDRFWWSQDDGGTWTQLHASIRNVVCFGLGKPAPAQKRPAVYFYGAVDGVIGLFASFDWFRSKPTLLSRFPSPQLAPVTAIVGDANHFGRAWVGTPGAGWLLVDVDLRRIP